MLDAFGRAPGGVLVGTQVVAKGHDFPDVALGVVVDADQTLRFPDFRAEERTFALVAQLAGRAGRGRHGRVLVQTLDPTAPAIAHAARHDADGFLAGELARREALRYPPFASLIRVVCSAPGGRCGPRRGHGACAPGSTPRAPPCSARRRCFACAARSACSSSSRPPAAARRSPPSAPPWRPSRRPPRAAPSRLSVDVDPQ